MEIWPRSGGKTHSNSPLTASSKGVSEIELLKITSPGMMQTAEVWNSSQSYGGHRLAISTHVGQAVERLQGERTMELQEHTIEIFKS